MAGFVLHLFPIVAKEHISPLFVNVCFNFTPFLSQVTMLLLMPAMGVFPGTFTAIGGAALFIGCTLLAMDYKDQNEIAAASFIGRKELDETAETS